MYYVPLKKEENELCENFFGLDGTLVMPDPHPGALPCLPLNVGWPSGISENPWITYRRLVNSIIIQSFPEPSSATLDPQNSASRLFLFCMQMPQSSRAEATVIWGWSIDDLGLILKRSRADAADPGAEIYL